MKHLAILIFLAGSSLAYSQTQQADQVCLSMVLIRAPETDTPAEQMRNSAQQGSSFSDLARANSQGVAAAEGGALGCFKRGTLSKQLEDRVFKMQAGEVSEVMHTKQGFVLFYVTEHKVP
jgi:peptidyl-prolyl cis-trans isomerase SurA